MKILHTADWHIGKSLYKHGLEEEMHHFISWLMVFVKERKVDVVLISGDIFDLTNPSNESEKIYYNALISLRDIGVRVIITGGNHDSISKLDAPSFILHALNISVYGGLSQDYTKHIVPLTNVKGEVQAVVAAVPYIRDKDIRFELVGEDDRVTQMREGIQSVFMKMSSLAKETYPNKPLIGMGHLYLQSSQLSDSERDIQIGNAAGVEASAFQELFDYLALGHIHRPQSFCGGKVRYSGSPISLSFSERNDMKQVVLLDINDNLIDIEPIPIPKFRNLVKFVGSIQAIKSTLSNYTNELPLKAYGEVEINEPVYSAALMEDWNSFIQWFRSDHIFILKDKVTFMDKRRSIADSVDSTSLQDLSPMEVFDRRIMNEHCSQDEKEWLKQTFAHIVEQVQSSL